MKTKKSSLSRLLAALLMIVTVFSSTLIFATAEGIEPTPATSEETSPDVYVYAADREALLEKSPIQKWSIDEDASTKYQIWHAEDPNTDGRTAEYHFIDLTDLDYDTVAIGIGNTKKNILCYAFLTELPTEDGEAVAYAEGTTYKKMETKASDWNNKLSGKLFFDEIPADAKYLVILGKYWSSESYGPVSVTFMRTDSNLLRNDLATYAYPVADLLAASHCIDGGSWATKDTGKTGDAIIPIAGTTFDAVTFQPAAGSSTVNYSFFTEIPGNWDDIATADESSNMKSATAGETVAIPAGANYLIVNHTKSSADVRPSEITFINTDAVADEGDALLGTIKTTATYAYPMNQLVQNGCLYGWGGKDYSHKWIETAENGHKTGFVDLTDRNYTSVSFVVGAGGYLGYGFLKEEPVLDQAVSYAGGATAFVGDSTYAAGTVVNAEIPADATTLVVWMKDDGDSTDYSPASMTFTYESECPVALEMYAGAEVRLSEKSGLRFTSRIPTAELAGLTDYTVGTLIFPTDKLDGALTVDTEGALNLTGATAVVDGDYTYFSAAIVDILPQNYARKFSAVSYIEIDGVYYYTEATSRSVYEVAVKSNAANPTADYADTVREFINAVVEIKDGVQVQPAGYTHPLTATIESGVLTITGEGLTEASLKTVILNGTIYTRGWSFADGKFTANIPQ